MELHDQGAREKRLVGFYRAMSPNQQYMLDQLVKELVALTPNPSSNVIQFPRRRLTTGTG